MKYLSLLSAIGAAVLLTMPAGPAVSASVADFYKDKRIKVIIGWPPGGGYDRYGRVLGRHFNRHIPGKPKIIVQNMPGAGSLTATNYLYNKAPQDGTVIGIVSRGIPVAPLMGTIDKKNARFDPLKFLWLGSLNNEVSTVVAYKDSPIKSIQDAMEREMIVGGMTPTSDPVLFAYVLNNVLGTKFRVISGYPGLGFLAMAMERGEIEGRLGWSWSSIKSSKLDWVKDGTLKIILQNSTRKHPELKDVPLVMDLAKTEKDRQILQLVFAPQAMGRPFMATPNIPPERQKALRDAFDATVKDPAFLKDAKQVKLEITPVNGATVEKLLKSIYASPPDIVAAARAAIKRGSTGYSVTKIPYYTVSAKILKIQRGGRRIVFMDKGKKSKAGISGRRTKITVAGKKVKRKALKEGLSCKINYQGSGATAKSVDCE